MILAIVVALATFVVQCPSDIVGSRAVPGRKSAPTAREDGGRPARPGAVQTVGRDGQRPAIPDAPDRLDAAELKARLHRPLPALHSELVALSLQIRDHPGSLPQFVRDILLDPCESPLVRACCALQLGLSDRQPYGKRELVQLMPRLPLELRPLLAMSLGLRPLGASESEAVLRDFWLDTLAFPLARFRKPNEVDQLLHARFAQASEGRNADPYSFTASFATYCETGQCFYKRLDKVQDPALEGAILEVLCDKDGPRDLATLGHLLDARSQAARAEMESILLDPGQPSPLRYQAAQLLAMNGDTRSRTALLQVALLPDPQSLIIFSRSVAPLAEVDRIGLFNDLLLMPSSVERRGEYIGLLARTGSADAGSSALQAALTRCPTIESKLQLLNGACNVEFIPASARLAILSVAARDRSSEVRQAAARWLEEMGGPDAERLVGTMRADPDLEVRRPAQGAGGR